ncbi:uncharacterized protein Tco025E_02807 [Trypanosoma conorhini]|uniref:Uncharacterized protein n=1 Tax=Trypanosoma conorhini TaxID=83891 RepID=A0A3R7LGV9_9TRYP|nr:uncharacterized protein Tco025E_02807 [Trypanosoma conorhini]RNF23515.1 hypothetical protein Tco025E_02807 [Trypanosoma conorhini]
MQRQAPQREIGRGGAHSRQGVGALLCGGRLAIRRRNRQTGGARGADCPGEAAACRLRRHRSGAPPLRASNCDIAKARSSLLCEAAKRQVPARLSDAVLFGVRSGGRLATACGTVRFTALRAAAANCRMPPWIFTDERSVCRMRGGSR